VLARAGLPTQGQRGPLLQRRVRAHTRSTSALCGCRESIAKGLPESASRATNVNSADSCSCPACCSSIRRSTLLLPVHTARPVICRGARQARPAVCASAHTGALPPQAFDGFPQATRHHRSGQQRLPNGGTVMHCTAQKACRLPPYLVPV
jgi:hypothetical protein